MLEITFVLFVKISTNQYSLKSNTDITAKQFNDVCIQTTAELANLTKYNIVGVVHSQKRSSHGRKHTYCITFWFCRYGFEQ